MNAINADRIRSDVHPMRIGCAPRASVNIPNVALLFSFCVSPLSIK